MNRKQERFCQAVAEGVPDGEAARLAGYKGPAGTRLRKMPEVQQRLEALSSLRQETVAGQEEVLGQLTRLMRQEDLPLREQLHVLELLGKHYGLFDGRGSGGDVVRIVDDLP